MSMLVNSFMAAAGVIAPYPFYVASAAEVTHVGNSSWTALVSQTFTGLTIGVKYAAFFSGEFGIGTANTNCIGRMTLDGVQLRALLHRPSVVSGSYQSLAGFQVFTATATSHALVVDIQNGTAASTAKAKNGRIVLLPLGADDYETYSSGIVTATTTTPVTAATLAFTPASSGDYLILASANVASTSTASNSIMTVALSGNATPANELVTGSGTGTNNYAHLIAWKRAALSGAQSVTVRVAENGSATANIKEVSVLALRLDRFAHSAVAELGAEESGTATTYTDSHTQTITAAHANYLTIGALAVGSSTTTAQAASARMDDGTGQTGTSVHYAQASGSGKYQPAAFLGVAEQAAGSVTQKLQRKAETSNTVYIAPGSTLVALDLTGIA